MSLPDAPTRRAPKPVTGLLIERALGRCLAAFCVVFGAQAIPFVLDQHVLPPLWKFIVLAVMYGAFSGIAILAVLGRSLAVLSRFVTVAFLLALVSWPIVAQSPAVVQPHVPWLWYLCNIATAAAVFAYTTWIAAVYCVLLPALFFVILQTPAGSGASVEKAILDSLYALVLGLAILILGSLLRRAAAAVDAAQAGAVVRYSEAVRQHATEVERVEVDAMVHDGVLTTLLSAAKADTAAAKLLVAKMAVINIDRLTLETVVRAPDNHPVPLSRMQERLVDELARLDPEASITPVRDIPAMLLPADVAETLVSAATQALVNSCQHAGDGASRQVRIRVVEGVAEIIVSDDGVGYDTSMPSERLGVRVSILERVTNSGGSAQVRSTIGAGTTVTLRWTSASFVLNGLRA